MTDPFRIDGPTCISFSGGRTSAYAGGEGTMDSLVSIGRSRTRASCRAAAGGPTFQRP